MLQRIALASIGVGIVVLTLKGLAAWLTGSVALLSDALESIVNVATAIVAFLAIRYSQRPADANHPYGHQKAEYFAALIEAILIGAAAFAIIREAIVALGAGRVVYVSNAGLALNLVASLINAAWCAVLLRQGRRLKSPALVADGTHLLTDVVTSAGVLVGVLVARATGIWWLDPLLALLVAVNILWSGWALLRSSLGGLMDMAPPEEDLQKMRAIIAEAGQGALQAHDLHSRHSGNLTFIEFHLIAPADMTVGESHDICDWIEDGLRAEFGNCRITIHVEPEAKAERHAIAMQPPS
ncbi:cation diffusion facilitator family transporter [Halovulum sp. GXIMD14793]